MREIQFSGALDAYGGGLHWAPHIADRDILDEIAVMWPRKTYGIRPSLKVFLGTQPNPNSGVQMEGDFRSCHGFGGTDVTPADPPEIKVGDIDLFAELRNHDGEVVLLIVEGP